MTICTLDIIIVSVFINYTYGMFCMQVFSLCRLPLVSSLFQYSNTYGTWFPVSTGKKSLKGVIFILKKCDHIDI